MQNRNEPEDKIVDVTFSGCMVVDRGGGLRVCGRQLESVRNVLGATGFGSNNDSATFHDADLIKVEKFMKTQRANFAAGSMYPDDVIEKSFHDSLRANISNMRSATRVSIDKTSQSHPSRTKTPEVLPADGRVDVRVSGKFLVERKEISPDMLAVFMNSIQQRLNSNSVSQPDENCGFTVYGAKSSLVASLKSDFLENHCRIKLGEGGSLRLEILRPLQNNNSLSPNKPASSTPTGKEVEPIKLGNPDQGRKPTLVQSPKGGKPWKMFAKAKSNS